jgi:hypothetical protein
MDFRIAEPSTKDADIGKLGRWSGERVLCENELLIAVAGGRKGDLTLRAIGPGTEPLAPLKEAESGDGRDGEEANAPKAPEGLGRPNPGDVPLFEGGPNGSRNGEEGNRCAGGVCIDDDKADRMGTGLAMASSW